MVEAYEKEAPFNDKKKVENKLAKRMTARVSRRWIGLQENKEKNIKARKGLGFLGAVGWYVPLPTALGALAGRWLDKNYPQTSLSWSLNLILLGLVVGLFSAGKWLKREAIDHAIKEQKIRNEQLERIQKECCLSDEEEKERME